MKKTISIISCCLLICLLFIRNDLKSYFLCYEKSDFEGMKKFCSKNFVDEFFHDGDVFGNSTAKLVDIEEIKYDEDAMKYIAGVQIECMPTEGSALYNFEKPDVPVNTYMYLVLSVNNGNAIIEAFAD